MAKKFPIPKSLIPGELPRYIVELINSNLKGIDSTREGGYIVKIGLFGVSGAGKSTIYSVIRNTGETFSGEFLNIYNQCDSIRTNLRSTLQMNVNGFTVLEYPDINNQKKSASTILKDFPGQEGYFMEYLKNGKKEQIADLDAFIFVLDSTNPSSLNIFSYLEQLRGINPTAITAVYLHKSDLPEELKTLKLDKVRDTVEEYGLNTAMLFETTAVLNQDNIDIIIKDEVNNLILEGSSLKEEFLELFHNFSFSDIEKILGEKIPEDFFDMSEKEMNKQIDYRLERKIETLTDGDIKDLLYLSYKNSILYNYGVGNFIKECKKEGYSNVWTNFLFTMPAIVSNLLKTKKDRVKVKKGRGCLALKKNPVSEGVPSSELKESNINSGNSLEELLVNLRKKSNTLNFKDKPNNTFKNFGSFFYFSNSLVDSNRFPSCETKEGFESLCNYFEEILNSKNNSIVYFDALIRKGDHYINLLYNGYSVCSVVSKGNQIESLRRSIDSISQNIDEEVPDNMIISLEEMRKILTKNSKKEHSRLQKEKKNAPDIIKDEDKFELYYIGGKQLYNKKNPGNSARHFYSSKDNFEKSLVGMITSDLSLNGDDSLVGGTPHNNNVLVNSITNMVLLTSNIIGKSLDETPVELIDGNIKISDDEYKLMACISEDFSQLWFVLAKPFLDSSEGEETVSYRTIRRSLNRINRERNIQSYLEPENPDLNLISILGKDNPLSKFGGLIVEN